MASIGVLQMSNKGPRRSSFVIVPWGKVKQKPKEHIGTQLTEPTVNTKTAGCKTRKKRFTQLLPPPLLLLHLFIFASTQWSSIYQFTNFTAQNRFHNTEDHHVEVPQQRKCKKVSVYVFWQSIWLVGPCGTSAKGPHC